MPKLAILGANGVYARHLLPRLAAAGIETRAIVRRPEAAAVARACGAEIAQADIFDGASLRAALKGCDTCLNLATALPGPSGRGDFDANDRLRREGVPVLLEACAAEGVSRLMQQSIAMICTGGDAWMDGTESPSPTGDGVPAKALRATLEMEAAVKDAPLDWLILRGGLFHGPGTGATDAWHDLAAAGKLRMPGEGEDYVSYVHIADMAAATVAALTRWPSHETIAVTDGHPMRWREIFAYVATLVDGPAPGPSHRPGFASFRVSNARAREMLGWAPLYPDIRAGIAR